MSAPIRFPSLARASDARIVRILVTVVALAYFVSPQRVITDSTNYLLLASALANRLSACVTPETEGQSARFVQGEPPDNYVETPTGCVTPLFPHGTAFLVAPFVRLAEAAGIDVRRAQSGPRNDAYLQHLLASLLAASSIAALYLACRTWLAKEHALLLAGAFGFGTSFYSTASRVLWTITGELLLCCVGLALALHLERGTSARRAAAFGSVVAWLPFARPTGLLPALALLAIAAIKDRRALRIAAPVAAAWLVAFVVYWHAVFGAPVPPYYLVDRLTPNEYWIALVGNSVSPSRGVLVYSPFLLVTLLVFAAPWFGRLAREQRQICAVALSVIVVHWIVVSSFCHWFGGHGIGPRLMAETLPWFAVLGAGLWSAALAGGVDEHARARPRLVRALAATAVAALTVLAIGFHTYASVSDRPWGWNGDPTDIDQTPERIFEWKHAQPWAGLFD